LVDVNTEKNKSYTELAQNMANHMYAPQHYIQQ